MLNIVVSRKNVTENSTVAKRIRLTFEKTRGMQKPAKSRTLIFKISDLRGSLKQNWNKSETTQELEQNVVKQKNN
jgi:glucosamine 6-phosphate synthetase-like amidotransferase/phosphosugar isomerase protein